MAAYGNMEKAVPGLLYGLHHQIDSRLVSGGAIPFGVAVSAANGDQIVIGGSNVLGIVARTALDQATNKVGDCVNVVRTGKVWAEASEAIAADAEVAVDSTTGKIVAKPGSTTAGKINTGWHARTALDAAGLILIDLD